MKKGKIVIMIIAIAIVFLTAIIMASSYDDKRKEEAGVNDEVVIDDQIGRAHV